MPGGCSLSETKNERAAQLERGLAAAELHAAAAEKSALEKQTQLKTIDAHQALEANSSDHSWSRSRRTRLL